MSNIGLIIEERAANIGNFLVGRLIPFRQKRMVGPFIFIDHMGPAFLSENESLDVLPHPHIGLSTLTYLFEGSILHRDSIGNEIEIKPGAINWMNAGKGVVHSERTPNYLKGKTKTLHGLQIWVALPLHLEDMEPDFHHIEADAVPIWTDDTGIHYKLVAGEIANKKSPVPTHSPLYMLELNCEADVNCSIGKYLFGESGLYILEGEVEIEGNTFGSKQMLVANNAMLCEFKMKAGARVFIFGGEPFAEERFIDWNFVSADKEKLQKAKYMWEKQEFPKVLNETDWVPYPTRKTNEQR